MPAYSLTKSVIPGLYPLFAVHGIMFNRNLESRILETMLVAPEILNIDA